MKIKICAKIKPNIELDSLRECGFNWFRADYEKGTYWQKGDVTICSGDREVTYTKLTQEVIDTILSLCCKGFVILGD